MNATLLLIGLLITCTGTLLLALGFKGFDKDRTKLFIERCTTVTDGIIDGFDDTKVLTRKKRDYYYYEKYQRTKITTLTYYAPVVLFSDKNVEYRATYFRPMEKKLNQGQKIRIQYNPENPYEYIIVGDKYLKTNSQSAKTTGFFILILGVLMILYSVGIINF